MDLRIYDIMDLWIYDIMDQQIYDIMDLRIYDIMDLWICDIVDLRIYDKMDLRIYDIMYLWICDIVDLRIGTTLVPKTNFNCSCWQWRDQDLLHWWYFKFLSPSTFFSYPFRGSSIRAYAPTLITTPTYDKSLIAWNVVI